MSFADSHTSWGQTEGTHSVSDAPPPPQTQPLFHQALTRGSSQWAGPACHLVEEHGLQEVNDGGLVVYLADREQGGVWGC